MFALVSLVAAACGSSGDDDSGPQPEDLIGTWDATNAEVTWEVTDDVITTTFGGGIETEYTATATTLEMGEDTGELACPSGQVGVYDWEISDDVLTLSLVSDDCAGRGETIDGLSFERTEDGS